jgi:hypothetical protein
MVSPTRPLSRKSSTITTTSNAYDISLYYADMDDIHKQNDRIKDIAADYSLTTKAIDTMCGLKEQIKDLMRRADAISLALTHNETTMVQLLQGTGERAKVVEHLDDIHNVLQAVRTSTAAQHSQSIQNSLVRSLTKFKNLHSNAVDLHIQELQESFANTDPYPPPIPHAKRSPKTQEPTREISKEVDEIEDKEEQPIKPNNVEPMDEDEDIPPLPTIISAIRSRSPQGSTTPTLAEEVDHIEAYLNMYHTAPIEPTRFHPPKGYHSLRKGGEKDTTYWNSIMAVFMDIGDTTSINRRGINIAMLRGGPDHAPFFICEYHNGGYAIGPSKKKLAPYAIGDESF